MTEPGPSGSDDLRQRGEPFDISNEFARVRVTKVWTHNGERLEFESTRLGYVVRLDALLLESLTWQTPDSLSRLLADPFGPAKSNGQSHERPSRTEGRMAPPERG